MSVNTIYRTVRRELVFAGYRIKSKLLSMRDAGYGIACAYYDVAEFDMDRRIPEWWRYWLCFKADAICTVLDVLSLEKPIWWRVWAGELR